MGIDVWDVIEAAKTKPFGFMPFYPGPGLGGHCIPIDPFYLTWKAREVGYPTRFIELAGEINVSMPRYVTQNLERALDKHSSRSLGASSVLVIGLAYKKNVSDIRESPSLALMQTLRERGTQVAYHDPHVAVIPPTREYGSLAGLRSAELTEDLISSFDAVLVATDHDSVDYDLIHAHAKLIVDTRNAFERRGHRGVKIVKT
jgi:UDP-N-acetyl-D-glucosamine dehydrogenase